MKKILVAGCALFAMTIIQAQQKEGTVIYERTTQIQIRINDGHEGMENMLPKQRKDNFELIFGNNQSLWKQAEKEQEGTEDFGGGGVQIRMIGGGTDDVLYNNLETKVRVEQRDMFEKKFIIDDSIRPLKWKMTAETKTILGHTCMKATATQTSIRTQMTMDNGKMERKQVEDTSLIVAWFATDIPVSAGPAEYQGQLPGLILEMDVANGRQVFKALEISSKADIASIKAPTGKKRYTREEYRKEVDKMIDEMQRNNSGPGRVMRFSN
ncbi:MAG: GLPGLI family protein [Chitinophagaceae bacterium]|nr:GLPGLI family protein [Chitinophagaceae bacterium]